MNVPAVLTSFALMTLSTLSANEARFYVGTYTSKGTCEGVLMGSLDQETGRIGPITLAGKAVDPSFVTLSPDGKHLYAALESGPGAVESFSVNPDGTLKSLNQQPTGGAATCHVWVNGNQLLAANYSGGNISAFPINPDGSLGARNQLVQFTGSGPNANRQQQAFAHGIYTDRSGSFAYVCDLGSDQVWCFRVDKATGTLTPLDPPSVKVPAGNGPRHLVLSADDRFLYVNGELNHIVGVYERDAKTGLLILLQEINALPDQTPDDNVTCAEIALHPSGHWLYVSHRGYNAVTLFAVGADGKLTRVETVDAPVNFPRGFDIDPSGRWLVIAGQFDGKLSVFKIDQTSGKLTPTGQTVEAGTPVSVLFVKP